VNGAGFGPGVAVFFGDDAAEIVDVAPDQLQVIVPANATVAGPVDVRVEQDADLVTLPAGYRRVRGTPTFEALDVVALLDPGASPAANDMAMGQLVGDDAIDIVVSGENGAAFLAVAEGDGAGGFTVAWQDEEDALSVAIADLDEDGALDLVAQGSPGLRTYLADGMGGFVVDGISGVVPYARGIAILDADHLDGPDVVVRGAYDQGIQVWRNDGTGGLFAPVTLAAGEIESIDRIVHPSTGDFTGDGFDDIVVPVQPPVAPSAGFAAFVNDGAGGFLSPSFTDVGTAGTDSVAASFDLGLDDDLDVLALGYDIGLYALHGNGDGTFDDVQITWPLPAGAAFVRAGDLNCDGDIDLVVDDAVGSVAVYTGAPTGAFTLGSTETFSDQGGNSGLAVEDVDGDALDDILVSHYAGTVLEIHTYRNTSGD
jgi:hypothetical protein